MNIEELLKLAEAGDSESIAVIFELGLEYFKGEKIEQDIEKAAYLTKKAATLGYLEAQIFLATFFKDDDDKEQHVYWVTQAAQQGDAMSQLHLAFCYYYKGMGTIQDYEQVIYWCKQAINRNDTEITGNAKALLGRCYFDGTGVPVDVEIARKLWEDAKALGNEHAKGFLGEIYLKDIEQSNSSISTATPRNNEEEQAKNNAKAAMILGIIGLITCISPLSLAAIILGYTSSKKCSNDSAMKNAKIGMTTGIIACSIVAFFIIIAIFSSL